MAAAERDAAAVALRFKQDALSYGELAREVESCAHALAALGLARRDRVAVYLPKCFEAVIAMFGAAAAGCVFVPVNSVLKPPQVAHILADCNVRLLVTSRARLAELEAVLESCPDLETVITVDTGEVGDGSGERPVLAWREALARRGGTVQRVIDADMVSILYTSGSTGKPKGVVLSHKNMVTGARSVASYLENVAEDRILSVLPLSFDAGFSQLTTAFVAGASVVLLDYLLPQDVVRTLERERITGLTGVPPLWIQILGTRWPEGAARSLRYFANTGGSMPRATLDRLRALAPQAKPYLMYGLTEAFRSTYLPPAEVDRRPDSIGKAIPDAEILVVRPDGTPCEPGEPGELVHRGSLVSLGYWNDAAKTAERFKPAPGLPRELMNPELAVWSGDTVRTDADGFIYFVGRRDEMIKTSGYRVSPTEIEEVVYGTGLVTDAVALGLPHPELGQSIVVVASPSAGGEGRDTEALLAECRRKLPNFMVPARIEWRAQLPRNPNGKFDRKLLAQELAAAASGTQ